MYTVGVVICAEHGFIGCNTLTAAAVAYNILLYTAAKLIINVITNSVLKTAMPPPRLFFAVHRAPYNSERCRRRRRRRRHRVYGLRAHTSSEENVVENRRRRKEGSRGTGVEDREHKTKTVQRPD